MPTLPHLLRPGLTAVLCGTAAGERSARANAYYAHPGNAFWRVLEATRLTPRELAPAEYRALLEYGIGLTDLTHAVAGPDDVTTRMPLDIAGLKRRLQRTAPKFVAFNGKRAAELVLERAVPFGPQPERLAGARVWVLPSTSGAARGVWDEAVWYAFARVVRRARVIAGQPTGPCDHTCPFAHSA